MPSFRRFIASSALFLGYEIYIDIDIHDTIESIIHEFYNNLYTVLSTHKFEILMEEVRKSVFHIHDVTMNDIRQMNIDDMVYICDEC
jgi:hypothetical protein